MTSQARQTFGDLYRVYERFEIIPDDLIDDGPMEWLQSAAKAFNDACIKLGNDRLTVSMAVTLCTEIEKRWCDVYRKEE